MGSCFSFDEHLTFIFCQNLAAFSCMYMFSQFCLFQKKRIADRVTPLLALCLTIRHVLSVNDLEPLLHWEEDVTFFILSLTLFTFYDVFGSLKVTAAILKNGVKCICGEHLDSITNHYFFILRKGVFLLS